MQITDELRNKIYQYFDKEGIKGSHLASVTFNIDQLSRLSQTENEREFEPNLNSFGLNSEEAKEIVLDYVYETTNIRLGSVNELMKLRILNGKPFFLLLNEHEYHKTKYCLAFGRLPGSVIFREKDKIDSLGNIEEIDGDLGLSDVTIKDLGKLKKVNGDFWIAQYTKTCLITSLSDLAYVGGDLNIKHTYITDLGNLKHVGGNLNLRNTLIKTIGQVEYIGKNLLLPKRLKGEIDLSHTKVIGKIKYYEDIKLPL